MSSFHDISAMREQISANISLTFSLLEPDVDTLNGSHRFTIVTRWIENSKNYEAHVVYGPRDCAIAGSKKCRDRLQAMHCLLDVTENMVHELFETETVKEVVGQRIIEVGFGGHGYFDGDLDGSS